MDEQAQLELDPLLDRQPVKFSRGRRSMTTRAAACSTRCNGANVESGSPVSTALQ